MKLFKNLSLAACAALFALTSCSSDDNAPGGFGDDPVSFQSGINTRMASDAWENQDAIGVYMINGGSVLANATIVDGAANMKYTTTGDGKFVHATPGDAITFPADGRTVDFIAYYPYEQTITNYAYEADVTDQSDPSKIDFLWTKAAGYSKTSSAVMLNFDHMLSAIRFVMTDQSGDPLTGVTVDIQGLAAKGAVNLSDATVTPTTGSEAPIDAVISGVTSNTAQSDAIMIPQTVPAGAKAVFTVSATGKQFTWDFSGITELEQNVRHIFKVTFKTDGTVTVTPDSNINGWDDQDEGDIDLDPEAPVGDGTKANPYSIAEISANVGATGVWVQGYIVGTEEAGALVTSGFTTNANVVLAATAGETVLANCVVVDITNDTGVQGALNLVDNATLLGEQIKVEGTIATATTMNNVTDQEGGITGGGTGQTLEFEETFGPTWRTAGQTGTQTKTWADFVALDQWDMKAPISYSTGSDPVDFRSTATYDDPHIWFAANYDKLFKIEGIESGFSGMTLTYDLAANAANADQTGMMVKCNGTDVTIPAGTLGSQNIFSTITFSIPDGTTTIEFYTTPTSNPTGRGYRLDNIKITGSK